ncbi:aldo/keto reductase [Lignipirellula cremea]|uniref:General stress protein 69 n=1 Tax=Lignipirellula cremea TaxID=2528010 RepID=A0A518DUJ2_9BACT|nr:aldo/keto reductase [Lignipirellula cremea]QDU95506.1 General stress protein 69 [Lignipirellula cremea]
MRQRKLGYTDLEFTTVGLGTWAIGGSGWRFAWGPQDDNESVAAIVKAVDLGVNWVDTAAVYGLGHAEVLVGRALKEISPSQRPLVATKCSRVENPDGSIVGNLKRESVIAECEASLQRLGVETIDLYQLHWPDPEADIEEGWQTLIDLKQQGKIRHLGVSNFNVEQMKRLQPLHPIASLQPPYSMIARGVEEEILEFCGENQIGVICYSPMGKGLLTGAFTRERAESLPEDDHRSRDPKFAEPLLGINLLMVERLKPIADRAGQTLPQLAVAWVLRREEVTAAIVGARRPDQIAGVAPGGDWVLSNDEIVEVQAALDERDQALAALGDIDTGRV